MTTITRRYQFSASHRLHADQLSDAENASVFGKCNNPHGHGHNYVLSVTVEGPIDTETGLIVNIQQLDRMLEQVILRAFAYRNLNLDVAHFVHTIPTTENVVQAISDLLDRQWTTWFGEHSTARLARIHLQETNRNGFEIVIKARRHSHALLFRDESVTVNV
jgi:6-pyruvoyltetrahydropterin/6-carboxytetrahydropterin synthase